MKRALLRNAIIVSIIIMMSLLDILVLDSIEPGFTYLIGILLLAEAVAFLHTFVYVRRTTIRSIRKYLTLYCSMIILLIIASILYTKITEYVFIYESYRIIYISFIVYPLILLIMLSLYKTKVVGDNRRLVVGLTSVLVVALMSLHGMFSILSINDVEIIENQNGQNTILVTDSFLLHGTTYEYTQVNPFFMDYEGIYDSW